MSMEEPEQPYPFQGHSPFNQPGVRGFQKGNPSGAWMEGQSHASNNIVAVTKRKQETIRLLLEGARFEDIANLLGVAKATIAGYLREPEVRKQLMELNSVLLGSIDLELAMRYRSKAEIVDELAYIALGEMRSILSNPNAHPGIKAKMIDSVLDRTPELSRTKKLDVTSRTFSMKAEDLLAAANAAREIDERNRMKEAEESVVDNPDSEQNLVRE